MNLKENPWRAKCQLQKVKNQGAQRDNYLETLPNSNYIFRQLLESSETSFNTKEDFIDSSLTSSLNSFEFIVLTTFISSGEFRVF